MTRQSGFVDMGAYELPCEPCVADITGPQGPGQPDGNVNSLDRLLFIAQWGEPCNLAGHPTCYADITGPSGVPDGNVNSLDWLLHIAQWGSPANCACVPAQ